MANCAFIFTLMPFENAMNVSVLSPHTGWQTSKCLTDSTGAHHVRGSILQHKEPPFNRNNEALQGRRQNWLLLPNVQSAPALPPPPPPPRTGSLWHTGMKFKHPCLIWKKKKSNRSLWIRFSLCGWNVKTTQWELELRNMGPLFKPRMVGMSPGYV